MILDLYSLKSLTNGACRVIQENGYFSFYRFTEEQERLYKERSADFYNKTFSTSGITLKFKTDSTQLFIDTEIFKGTSRSYFAFDLVINGKLVDSLCNFSEESLSRDYTTEVLPLGNHSKTFELGDGEKEVMLYFPYSVDAKVKEISLNGSFITPVKFDKKLLAFGDSITHGYDALHPSNKYITRIAEALGAEEYNKAIGGEIFFPELASTSEEFTPDYVMVAYGTNDWSKCDRNTFVENTKRFYANLAQKYPSSTIFALTPIWRKGNESTEKAFAFSEIEGVIREACAPYDNIKVISCFDFVPHDENNFADLRLHPNDKGFDFYYNGLLDRIKEML